jgi:uncharacterized membrane protein YdbT with pleckstrin-like domain
MTDESLMQGEEVVYQTEKHWMAPLADSWKAILMLLGAAVVAWLQPEQTDGIMGFVGRLLELARLGLLFGGLLWIVYNILNWRVAWVKVTNLRVLGQEGLLRRKETDSLLSSISDVRAKSSFVGRTLKYGDITIFTASGEAGADTFTSMKDADRLKKVILEQKTKLTGTFATAVGAAAGAVDDSRAHPAPAPAGQAETMAALTSLGKLRDSGVITAEEFEVKKQELLARI